MNHGFKCPACGSIRLEEVLSGVTVSTEINEVGKGGDITYGLMDQTDGDDPRYQCLSCGRVLPNVDNSEDLYKYLQNPDLYENPTIMAEAHSDDRAATIKFNAAKWFDQATYQELVDLAACGWGGDYPADQVAQYMAAHVPELAEMFIYIETARVVKDIGFECHVDKKQALAWIKVHSPDAYENIDKDDEEEDEEQ